MKIFYLEFNAFTLCSSVFMKNESYMSFSIRQDFPIKLIISPVKENNSKLWTQSANKLLQLAQGILGGGYVQLIILILFTN